MVHYFRINSSKKLDSIIADISQRYTKEFINNQRSILAKCLVGDESISRPMILWISDIDLIDNQTLTIKLSDYYYSINILFKAKELEEDALFIEYVAKGEYYLGQKIKVQNIQNTKLVNNDNQLDFSNPVVNAQNRDIFKLSLNSLIAVSNESSIGEWDSPLWKSISQLNQNGGRTWNITGILIYKYPVFYCGQKSVYMQSTYEYLSEDIINKIQEEISHELDSRSSSLEGQINIEEKKQEIEAKYGFDNSSIHFGIVIQSELDSINEGNKYMLIIVSNMSLESYDTLKVGQTISWANLYPDSYRYKRFSFPLVFKTVKQSNIIIEDKFTKGLKADDINQNYWDFRSHIESRYFDYNGKEPLWIEFQNYGFVYIVGIVIKVFTTNDRPNSAGKLEVKSFIMVTSNLTLVNVSVHKPAFILQKSFVEGETYLIQNLNYDSSSEFHETGESSIAMSKYSEKKDKNSSLK